MKEQNNMPMHEPMRMGDLELARVYVVSQPYVGMFPLDEALEKGSLFPNLYKPYKKYK